MKTVPISTDIFSPAAIEQTMDAYSRVAKTAVRYDSSYAFVTFESCLHDEVLTVKEFVNYLIGVENS